MNDHYDIGAVLAIGVFIVAPIALTRISDVKLRNTIAVSVLAFLVGVASVVGRPRRPW